MRDYVNCEFVCYANDNTALIPEQWALEALALLSENMVVANLVNRDFSMEIADFGDVVNTSKPQSFKVTRTNDSSGLKLQDAKSTKIPVKLDQRFSVAFVIKDGERAKAQADLFARYLTPAVTTIARGIDRAILGQAHKLLGNRAGRLNNLTSANAKKFIIEARQKLNDNNVPFEGRSLLLSSQSESALLACDDFTDASKRGDSGAAVTKGLLGYILGFQTYLAQNVPSAETAGRDVAKGTVTNAADDGASGSQAVSVTGYAAVAGEYAVVSGNDQPTFITAAVTTAGDTTAVSLNEPNKYGTAASAAITVYKHATVKGVYEADHDEEIVIDGWTSAPATGQFIAFGTGTSRQVYTIIESSAGDAAGEQKVLLDRPLEVGLADDSFAFPGPGGAYNVPLYQDAIAFVTRPLVPANDGATSAVMSGNGIALRVTFQYDIHAGGTIVNVDVLGGVKVLDEDLAGVLLG